MTEIMKVETEKDYGDIWDRGPWNDIQYIRSDKGKFYLDNDQYPKYFKCRPAQDAHFCDSWVEVPKSAYDEYKARMIRILEIMVDELKKKE